MDGIELTFDDDALSFIVDKAVEYKLGARGLRNIVETIMRPAMFNLPSQRKRHFNITRKFAESTLENLKIA
ncbi:MAG: ATP-dependent Clp protease ATP-binding subunit ClpX, partial [Bacteroidaceae bacterium]|nr:ATP-dependent Clp protease ATP-binding subunit ClpX [Bacteroidaceae bacterium]